MKIIMKSKVWKWWGESEYSEELSMKVKKKKKNESRSSRYRLFVTPYSPWNSPGQNTGVGGQPFPSPGDLPNPGIEPRSPTFWHILYQLSHKRSPGILEWVAQPFSSRSSQPRNRTRISCIAGRFFSNWAMREPSMANSKWWINGASTVIPFSSISPWKSFEFGNPFWTDLQYSQLHMCFYLQLATTLCLSKSTFCSLDNFTYKSYNIRIRSEY